MAEKSPIRVAVTGAPCNVSYALQLRIAAGEMFPAPTHSR